MTRKERNAEICRLYESGLSMQQIGARFSISHQRVGQILARLGIMTRYKIDEYKILDAAVIVSRGFTITYAADKLGLNRGSLDSALIRRGLYSRPPSDDRSWSSDETEFLLANYKQRLSAAQIADRLSRTRNEVIGKARRLGLCEPLEAAC